MSTADRPATDRSPAPRQRDGLTAMCQITYAKDVACPAGFAVPVERLGKAIISHARTPDLGERDAVKV